MHATRYMTIYTTPMHDYVYDLGKRPRPSTTGA
jgi:hypothetical protein